MKRVKPKKTGPKKVERSAANPQAGEVQVSDDLFSFFERLKNTSSIKRFGTLPMIQFESVAAHSFNVTALALMIADYEKSSDILIETVLRKALFHDFEESILSDIPHSIKHRYKGGRLAELLKEIVPDLIEDEIYKELPLSLKRNYIKHTKDAKHGKEGKIVEAADAMDTILTSIRELKLGNRYFEKVFDAALALAKKHDSLKFVKYFLEGAVAYRDDMKKTWGEDI
ncbi:HD family hydrolase [Fibrobacterota bacterium]